MISSCSAPTSFRIRPVRNPLSDRAQQVTPRPPHEVFEVLDRGRGKLQRRLLRSQQPRDAGVTAQHADPVSSKRDDSFERREPVVRKRSIDTLDGDTNRFTEHLLQGGEVPEDRARRDRHVLRQGGSGQRLPPPLPQNLEGCHGDLVASFIRRLPRPRHGLLISKFLLICQGVGGDFVIVHLPGRGPTGSSSSRRSRTPLGCRGSPGPACGSPLETRPFRCDRGCAGPSARCVACETHPPRGQPPSPRVRRRWPGREARTVRRCRGARRWATDVRDYRCRRRATRGSAATAYPTRARSRATAHPRGPSGIGVPAGRTWQTAPSPPSSCWVKQNPSSNGH